MNEDYFDTLDSNDTWFIPTTDDEDAIIVRVSNRFYIWQQGQELLELVPKKLIHPIDY